MIVIVATTMLAADCTFERVEVTQQMPPVIERTCLESYDSFILEQYNADNYGAVSRINEDGKISITVDYVLDVLDNVEVQ